MKPQKVEPFTVEEIDREMAVMEKKIQELQKLVQRRNDLSNLKLLTLRLRGERETPLSTQVALPDSENRKAPSGTTGDLACRILSSRGPMNLSDLMFAMRADGWKGSGEDLRDRKRIYAAMYTAKDRFEQDGNMWKVR